MEKILKAIPQKLEPTGLYLTEVERKHIAEALRKAGFQQCGETTDAPDQVQGMAKELFEYGIEYDPLIIGYEGDIAKHLTSKGYRKASEVAREIFEEIERLLDNHHSAYLPVGALEADTCYEGGLGGAVAELKKKYTEEQNDERE